MRLLPFAALWLALLASPALAADPIMPLEQVERGMQCEGRSVVRGTDIATFDVEILDVIAQDPQGVGPVILFRASGPAVDETGMGFGFSGSPIYCPDSDGRDAQRGRGVRGRRGLRQRHRARHADRIDPVDARRDSAAGTSRDRRRAQRGAVDAPR